MTPEEKHNFDSRLHDLEGKILNNDSLPDLMKRLQEIETKLLPFVESMNNRFQVVNKLVEDFKQVKSVSEFLNNIVISNTDALFSHKKEVESVSKSLQNVNELLGVLAVNHSSDLSHIKNELKDCKGNQDLNRVSTISQINNLRSEIETKLQDKPGKADLDFSHNILKVLINDVKGKAEDHRKEFDGFKQKISAELSGGLDLTVSSARYIRDQKANQDAIDALKSQIISIQENTSSSMSSLKDMVKVAQQEMLSALIKQPDPNATLKSDFDKKIEPIALDAKNAVTRSQNSDQKIMLIEKRIESINLLLKKYELNQ